MIEIFLNALEKNYTSFMTSVKDILPEVIWALFILGTGLIISRWIYLIVIYLFKRFKIIDLLNKLNIVLSDETEEKDNKWKNKKSINLFWEKIKIDSIVAKAISYYIFLLFFRISIKYIWIDDIEDFLNSVIWYLPKLFIWVAIWYFGVRFANFIYDILYHTLDLTKQPNAKLVAIVWKIIILFFTTLAVLNQIQIVDTIIYQTILIWFISMISLAWGLAFWLWWKDVAKEILESFKK